MPRKNKHVLENESKTRPEIFHVEWEMRWYKHDRAENWKKAQKIISLKKPKK